MMNKAGGKAVGELLEDLIFRLGKNSDTPGLDARGLLSHVMARPPAWLMAHPEILPDPQPGRHAGETGFPP